MGLILAAFSIPLNKVSLIEGCDLGKGAGLMTGEKLKSSVPTGYAPS